MWLTTVTVWLFSREGVAKSPCKCGSRGGIYRAEASAMVYSLVETAKANKLKIYEYLKHLLTEIPKHMDDTSLTFLDDLLPWSENLPEECHKKI